MRTSVLSVAITTETQTDRGVTEKKRELLVAGRAGALHVEFVQGRDDRIAISQKFLSGWTKRRILVELAC